MAEQRGQDVRQYIKDVDNNIRGLGNYPYGIREEFAEKAATGRVLYLYYPDDKRADGTPIVKPYTREDARRAGVFKTGSQYDIDETVPPTLGEKYAIMKTDQLNRAMRAGYTASELRILANNFDESVVQGSINAIGKYIAEAKDPHRAYLNVLQFPKIQAGTMKPRQGTGLPPNLAEGFSLLTNMEDRQKVLDNALKAWTDKLRVQSAQAKAAIDENKADILENEKQFNILINSFGKSGTDDAQFLIDAETILDNLGALGYDSDKLQKMQDLIVTETVVTEDDITGTDIVYAPTSVKSIVTLFERQIINEDPTLDLGDLAVALSDKQLSYKDFSRLSGEVVQVMDDNVKAALEMVRPALPEGLQLYNTQQNAQLNRYTNLKKDLLKAQRLAILENTELDPFQWVDDNKEKYFDTPKTNQDDELIAQLTPYTSDVNKLGSVALDEKIEELREELGADNEDVKALVELRELANDLHNSDPSILVNWKN